MAKDQLPVSDGVRTPLAECGGPNHDSFAWEGLGREFASLHDGLHGGDRKTSEPQAVSDVALRQLH